MKKEGFEGCFCAKQGFTLVELLVVVLIIGILAAVAVPQYQKAMWKSRNVQLKTLLSALIEAQKVYYLANGTYAQTLDQLDVDIPTSWTSARTTSGLCMYETSEKLDAVRYNEDIQVGISQSDSIFVNWLTGPYRCGGFVWWSLTGKIYCTERYNASFKAGAFCRGLEGKEYDSRPSTWRFYTY